jgi:hypothetical protein
MIQGMEVDSGGEVDVPDELAETFLRRGDFVPVPGADLALAGERMPEVRHQDMAPVADMSHMMLGGQEPVAEIEAV